MCEIERNLVENTITSICEMIIHATEEYKDVDGMTEDEAMTEAYRDALEILNEEVLSGEISCATEEYLRGVVSSNDMHDVSRTLSDEDVRKRALDIEMLDD